jgi:hypothetical protein
LTRRAERGFSDRLESDSVRGCGPLNPSSIRCDGEQHLAAVLVALNLLAFAIHTVCDIGDEIWRLARQKHGSRSHFFNNFASITSFLIFASWDDFFQTLAFTKQPPLPP